MIPCSAHLHVPGELFLALVVSSKAHAKIVHVDPTAALLMPGVVDYVDYRDVPGNNQTGYYAAKDEEIFASVEVGYFSTYILLAYVTRYISSLVNLYLSVAMDHILIFIYSTQTVSV